MSSQDETGWDSHPFQVLKCKWAHSKIWLLQPEHFVHVTQVISNDSPCKSPALTALGPRQDDVCPAELYLLGRSIPRWGRAIAYNLTINHLETRFVSSFWERCQHSMKQVVDSLWQSQFALSQQHLQLLQRNSNGCTCLLPMCADFSCLSTDLFIICLNSASYHTGRAHVRNHFFHQLPIVEAFDSFPELQTRVEM